MNKKITKWTSVCQGIVFGCFSLAAQHATEGWMSESPVLKQGVELRAAVPVDSSITYNLKGEYVYKNVTMQDGNSFHEKRYKWENNRWIEYDMVYDNTGVQSVMYHYVWYGAQWTQIMYTVYYPNSLVPNVNVDNNNPVDETNKGGFDIHTILAIDSVAEASFVVKLPADFALDPDNTQLTADWGDYELIITPLEGNEWLLIIRSKSSLRSAALLSDETSSIMAHIAYTVDGAVKRGTYDITVHSILFETEGGSSIPEPAITIPVNVNREVTGNEIIVASGIRSQGNALYVNVQQPSTLRVYALTGALVKQQALPAGETVVTLPRGAYIVQAGETRRKVVISE